MSTHLRDVDAWRSGGHIDEPLRGNGRSPPIIMLDRFVSVEIYGGKAALAGGLGPSVVLFRFHETVTRRDTRIRDGDGSKN
jgi:hypothetical protein